MQNLIKDHKENIFLLLGFILLSLVFFNPSLTFPYFLFDDFDNIAQNPNIPPQSLSNILFFWKDSSTPLIFNIWQFISLFTSVEQPYLFRFTNIIVHGVNGFLLFKVSRLLFPKHQIGLLVLTSSLFLIHPLQTESVVWISSARGVFSTTLLLLSLISYLKNRETSGQFPQKSFAFFIFSCLVKPSAIVLPFLLMILEKGFFKVSFKETIKRIHYFFYPALGLAFVHINDLLTVEFGNIDFNIRLIHALESLHHYFLKTVLPFNLKFDYGHTYLQTSLSVLRPSSLILPVMTLTLFVLSFFGLFLKQRKYTSLVFLTCFLASVSPTLGFVPFDFQNISTVADRYHYVALIFFSLFILSLAATSELWRKINTYFCLLALLFFIFLTPSRVYQWSNPASLVQGERSLSEVPSMLLPSLAFAARLHKNCPVILEMIQLKPDNHTVLLTSFLGCVIDTQNHHLARTYFSQHSVHLSDTELLILRGRVHLMLNDMSGFYYDLRQLSYLSLGAAQGLMHFVPKEHNSVDTSLAPLLKQVFSTVLFHHRPDWASSLIDWVDGLDEEHYQDLSQEMKLNLQNYQQLSH